MFEAGPSVTVTEGSGAGCSSKLDEDTKFVSCADAGSSSGKSNHRVTLPNELTGPGTDAMRPSLTMRSIGDSETPRCFAASFLLSSIVFSSGNISRVLRTGNGGPIQAPASSRDLTQ